MPEQQPVIRPGMDESIDDRHLPIGMPRLLQNVRVRQGARFEKRPGQAALTPTGLDASAFGAWMASMRDTVGAAVERVSTRTRPTLYFYETAATAPRWHAFGDVSRVQPIARTQVIGVDFSFSAVDCATVAARGSIFVASAPSSTTVRIQRFSLDGVALSPATTISTAARPRFVYPDSSSSTVYVVTRLTSGGGTTLQVRELNADTMALSSATNLATTLRDASDFHDVAALSGSTDWLIAYPESSTTIRVRRMAGTTSSNAVTITTASVPTRVAVAGTSGETVCVTYVDSTTFEAHVMTDTLGSGANVTVHTAAATETLLWTGLVRESATLWRVVCSVRDASAAPAVESNVTYHATVNSSASVTTGPSQVIGFMAASKPWAVVGASGTAQVFVLADNSMAGAFWLDQAAHYILELDSGGATGNAHVAAISYEHIAAERTNLYQVADVGSGRFAVAVAWQDQNQTAGIDLLSFNCAQPSQSVKAAHRFALETGGGVCVSGGMLAEFGEPSSTHYVVENGFAYDPLIAVAVASGSGLTADQQYTYRAVFVYQDALGKTHRSAPSRAVTVTPTGTDLNVTVRCTVLGVSGRLGTPNFVGLEIYRSWNGGPFYLANTSASVSASPPAVTATFVDSATDSSLEDNRVLYTDLQILPNEPPSGARLVCLGANRLFVVPWRETVVQFSKLFIATAPWEFCDDDAFRISVPERITALAWMDGALVIFSAVAIYVITGEGPNDQGVGSFSEPRELPTTVGCDDARSVVVTQQGVLFKGGGTIWLLPRGFGPPVPIGDAIQRTLAAYPHLRAAVRCVNDDDDCTHFLLANGDTSSAGTVVAVYNNTLGAWSRDQLACDIGAAGSVGGVFHALLATWNALSDKPARKLQNAVSDLDNDGAERWIESRIGFGDFRPWGPLGWGRMDRFQIHGEVAGHCDLNLVTVVEGVTNMVAAGVTITATKHMTGIGQFYAENAVKFPPGGAYRFDIYDSTPTLMTSGLVIHSVAFSASEPDGLRRLSDAERF